MLARAMRSKMNDVRTAMPGQVIKYDLKKQAVDVQPLLRHAYDDGSVLDLPVVYNVPVVFPRAGEAFLALPIKKGDGVLLIFSDRSLDKWKSSGGKVDPEDVRSHNISDAVAIPGFYPFNAAAKIPNANDLILKNANCTIMMKSNGKVSISNGKAELVSLAQTLAKTAQTMATKVAAAVPMNLATEIAQFSSLVSQIGGFKV